MDLKVLEKYGVTLSNALDPQSLVTLRAEYVKLVSGLEGSKETVETEQESFLKISKEQAEKNEETVKAVADAVSEIRALVNAVLDENISASFLLVDAIQGIKSEVLMERDYQMSVVKRNRPTASQVSEDFEAQKEEAGVLAEAIRNIFTMVREVLPKTKAFGESFPTKKSEAEGKKGELMPDLPKLPRTPGTGNVGRSAKVRRLRFAWAKRDPETGNFGEAEFLPAGTVVTDVAHDYVSNRKSGNVLDFLAIKEAIEVSGQKMFGDIPWVVEFPTGQLAGWLPESE